MSFHFQIRGSLRSKKYEVKRTNKKNTIVYYNKSHVFSYQLDCMFVHSKLKKKLSQFILTPSTNILNIYYQNTK